MNIEKYNEILGTLREIIKDTPFENHVFAVGGCVRDSIMGNDIKDIDIVVDLPNGGQELCEHLSRENLLARDYITFPAYSVANFVLSDYPDVEIEAVQTRKEKYDDKSSRNPLTAFGTIEEDCLRRDLTINSLYESVSTGERFDFTGMGIADIKNKVIRTPLDPIETFDDDPLRMLRVIRFAARFKFNLSDDLIDSIKKMSWRIKIVSRERIYDEVVKMLSDINAGQAMVYLQDTELASYVFGMSELYVNESEFVADMTLLHKYGYREKLVYIYMLYPDAPISWKKSDFENKITISMKELRCSNDDIDAVLSMWDYIYDWVHDSFKISKKYARKMCYEFKSYEKLCRCLFIAYLLAGDTEYEMFGYRLILEVATNCHYQNCGEIDMFGYKLPFTGDDIKEIFGLKQGPVIKDIRNKMLDIVFEKPDIKNDELIKEITIYLKTYPR